MKPEELVLELLGIHEILGENWIVDQTPLPELKSKLMAEKK